MGLRGSIGVTVVGTVLILAGLVVAWEWLFQKTSEEFAIHEVGRTGELSGRSALDPFITDEVVAGDPAAVERLAVAGTSLVREGGVVHVEIWSSTGKLLWANTPSLMGIVVELEAEERALMESQGRMVELSAHQVGVSDNVMFDQANPDTPNEVILEEINRQQPAPGRPQFPQYHQLSLREDSGSSDSGRQLKGQAGLWRRVCEFERRIGYS